MKAIQIRDKGKQNSFASRVITNFTTEGLIQPIGCVSNRHLAEDEIKFLLNQLLEKGITSYDVVSLAQERVVEGNEAEDDGLKPVVCKNTDGQWRLEFKLNGRRITVHKQDVIDLAVDAYKAEVERALINY